MADNDNVHIAPSELLGPLDGSRLKVVRAQQHVQLLKAKIGRFLKKHTQDIVVSDADTHTKTKQLLKPVPLQFSLVVGDCVTNARAALDYIMWELASKYFDSADIDLTTTEGRKITAFPLFNDLSAISKPDSPYSNRFNRFENLKLPAAIIHEIKAVQPHNTGYEPLWTLHELVNTDKHRVPLMTTAAFGGFMIFDTWLLKEIGRSLSAENPTINLGSMSIKAGGDAGSVTSPKGGMYVDVQPTICVAFQDPAMPREPVDVTLSNIVKCVAEVIPRFDRFF